MRRVPSCLWTQPLPASCAGANSAATTATPTPTSKREKPRLIPSFLDRRDAVTSVPQRAVARIQEGVLIGMRTVEDHVEARDVFISLYVESVPGVTIASIDDVGNLVRAGTQIVVVAPPVVVDHPIGPVAA